MSQKQRKPTARIYAHSQDEALLAARKSLGAVMTSS